MSEVTGKTIVYLPNWLGDMVMAVPFLNSLRAHLKDELWGIGRTSSIHLYNGLNIFDRFIPFDSKGMMSMLDAVTSIKNSGFQRAVVLPHSFRSALLFYMARINERTGYPRNKRGFMLTRHVPENNELEPTVEHYLKIMDVLGGKRLSDTPMLAITDDEEQKFDQDHTDVRQPYAVFITGAQYGPSKCWPPEHFSELADMISSAYSMKIYILPGKGEDSLARKIYEGVKRKEFMEIKSMGIRDLKVCLSRASVVVSNDTGPRHISVALNIPTVVLLGPMDEKYTRYTNNYTYVMAKEIPCRPCNNKKCDRNHECLKGISPAEVFLKVEEILNGSPQTRMLQEGYPEETVQGEER